MKTLFIFLISFVSTLKKKEVTFFKKTLRKNLLFKNRRKYNKTSLT